MLARLDFIALRRRVQLGAWHSRQDNMGAVVFAAAQSLAGLQSSADGGTEGKPNPADSPGPEQDVLAPLAGIRIIRCPPGVDLIQDTETVGIMEVLDHTKQHS